MRVMLMNGSPKKKISASGYIQMIMKMMLKKIDIIECPMHTKRDIPKGLDYLKGLDALVIESPLYVDGISSNVLSFLIEAERVCKENGYHFKVYVITNSGFIEGHQNEINLEQYECWAQRAGLIWGGGLGIGGGVALLWYGVFIIPTLIIEFAISAIENASIGSSIVDTSMLLTAGSNIFWFLFFSSGLFIGEAVMAHRIKRGKVGKNIYSRFMCPAIVFLIGADIFMLVLSIIKGGIFRNLFHRESV